MFDDIMAYDEIDIQEIPIFCSVSSSYKHLDEVEVN
ncbi:hypothetical protein PBI_GRAYSON_263 [Rhodococcus phage Grayson]|nr:hypothetical protein PBI_GRAYSON_263 [Rhodococcus phage Grayson]